MFERSGDAPPGAAYQPARSLAGAAAGEPAPAGALYLVFRLGPRLHALAAPPVLRVLHAPELSQPPGLPPLMAGLLNLHGTVLPVVHMGRLFGCAADAPSLYTPLLIMTDGERRIALMVDEVCGMRTAADDELQPVADTELLNDCVIGDLMSAEGPIHILHPTRILLEGERQRLAELQDLAQARLDALTDDGCA